MDYQKQPPKEFKTTMDYKGDQIKAAQKSKNNAILMAGSARDATLIVTTFYPEISKIEVAKRKEQIEFRWKEWRDWFYNQSDVPFIN